MCTFMASVTHFLWPCMTKKSRIGGPKPICSYNQVKLIRQSSNAWYLEGRAQCTCNNPEASQPPLRDHSFFVTICRIRARAQTLQGSQHHYGNIASNTPLVKVSIPNQPLPRVCTLLHSTNSVLGSKLAKTWTPLNVYLTQCFHIFKTKYCTEVLASFKKTVWGTTLQSMPESLTRWEANCSEPIVPFLHKSRAAPSCTAQLRPLPGSQLDVVDCLAHRNVPQR